MVFLLCIICFHSIERAVRQRAVGAEERGKWEWLCAVVQIILKCESIALLMASQ